MKGLGLGLILDRLMNVSVSVSE